MYILLHGSFPINVSDVGVTQPRIILWSTDDSTPVSLVITSPSSTSRGDERVKEHQGHVQGIGCKGGCATPRAFVVRRFAIKDFATLVLLYKITSRGL